MRNRNLLIAVISVMAATIAIGVILAANAPRYTPEERADGQHCEDVVKKEVESSLKSRLGEPGSLRDLDVLMMKSRSGRPPFLASVSWRAKNRHGGWDRGHDTLWLNEDCSSR